MEEPMKTVDMDVIIKELLRRAKVIDSMVEGIRYEIERIIEQLELATRNNVTIE